MTGPWVSQQMFDEVGRILAEREQGKLKQRVHRHYLRGLLTCMRCQARLLYTVVSGKTGDKFAYYVCSGRHRGRGCDLPYLPALEVEDRITCHWPTWVRLDQRDADAVGQLLHELVTSEGQGRFDLERGAQQRLARLEKERRKLLEMAYAEAIPLDLLKTEQDRIAREQEQTQRQLAEAGRSVELVEQAWQGARTVMQQGAAIYAVADAETKRQLNLAFLDRVEVDADEEKAVLREPWVAISRAATYARQERAASTKLATQVTCSVATGQRRRPSRTNPEPVDPVRGSSMNPLVEPRGLEPLTPTLPVWCATSCATAPDSR
jgi:site-specific DNA recombinase